MYQILYETGNEVMMIDGIHRYTWRKDAVRNEQKALIDYLVINKVLDVRLVRGMILSLGYYMVIRVRKCWM